MRPSERAANLRRANVNAGSPRRARRRTLFAPTAGPRSQPAVEVTADSGVDDGLDAGFDAGIAAVDPGQMSDLALEEFVIDDDDYPEVSAAQRRVEPAPAEPDRVDDIDDWLEEFAVSDYFDALPR